MLKLCFSRFNVRIFSMRCLCQKPLDRNKTIYSVLKPFVDFDDRLENLEKLEKNVKLRGLDIKLNSLIALWKHYKNVEVNIEKLEQERVRMVEDLVKIKDTADENTLKSLKFAAINVREDLKRLKVVFSELVEQIFPRVLELPNDIVEISDRALLSTDILVTNARDHLEVGKDLNVLEYISPRSYFLKGPAAVFELAVTAELTKLFIKNDFILFSNPDFTRNSIVKNLYLDDIQAVLPLEILRDDEEVDRLHLNGGASLFPFCCFHSKSVTNLMQLPLRYVTKGRHYSRSQLPGLYGVWQNTSLQIFIGTNETTVEEQLNNVITILKIFYINFKIPLRVIYCQPESLCKSEQMRISFQTYSSIHEQDIEIGNVSLYGDYISKRMRIYYNNELTNKFMHMISGTVLKVPPLLASILEHKHDSIANNVFNKNTL